MPSLPHKHFYISIKQFRNFALVSAALLFACNAAVLLAASLASSPASASADAPASQPADPHPDNPAIQADPILKAFPGNARALAFRSDAQHFTVEGKVREIDIVKIPNGSSETRIVLVGREQASSAPAHFTCHLDKKSESDAAGLKRGQIIRLTGSIGTTSAAENRIDLIRCHDLKSLGEPAIADQVVGEWRTGMLAIDTRRQRQAIQDAGGDVQNIPEGPVMSPGLYFDIRFNADHTLKAILRDPVEIKATRTGKWNLLKAGGEDHISIQFEGMPAVESTITSGKETIRFKLPPFAQGSDPSDITCDPVMGSPANIDWKAMREQSRTWLQANANIAPQAQQQFAQEIDGFLSGLNDGDGYTMVIGSNLSRNGRTNALVGFMGKFFVLPYSNAQTARNADISSGFSTSRMKAFWGDVYVPEVKIDSLTIDHQNQVDFSKPITGKLTMHALGNVNNGGFQAVIAFEGVKAFCYFKDKPGADEKTFDLSFGAADSPGHEQKHFNPRVALFFIARTADMDSKAVSEPVAMLLDAQN